MQSSSVVRWEKKVMIITFISEGICNICKSYHLPPHGQNQKTDPWSSLDWRCLSLDAFPLQSLFFCGSNFINQGNQGKVFIVCSSDIDSSTDIILEKILILACNLHLTVTLLPCFFLTEVKFKHTFPTSEHESSGLHLLTELPSYSSTRLHTLQHIIAHFTNFKQKLINIML